jgi:hypothetical protein
VLPASLREAAIEGRAYLLGRIDAGSGVDGQHSDASRRALSIAIHFHHSGKALDDGVGGGSFFVGASPETENRDVDEIRVFGPQLVVGDLKTLDNTWPEVLDDDVGALGESGQQCAPLFLGPVDANGAFSDIWN